MLGFYCSLDYTFVLVTALFLHQREDLERKRKKKLKFITSVEENHLDWSVLQKTIIIRFEDYVWICILAPSAKPS